MAAGSLAVLCLAADNSVSGGATNNISSVTDSLNNVWYLRHKPIFDNGTTSAGEQGLIAVTNMSAGALQTGSTITVTFADATTAKAYALWEIVPSANGVPVYVTGGVQAGSAVGATGTYTITTGTIPVADIAITVHAMESGTTQTYTADTDVTNGTWSSVQYSEVGTTTSGCCIASQYKIQTTTASTQAMDGGVLLAADSVGAWAQFSEVQVKRLALAGVG
jgi:hypothetical protein